MFRWGKSSKVPAPAGGGGGVAGEVAVHKVEKIEFLNLVHIKPPIRDVSGSTLRKKPGANGDADGAGARTPDSPDINRIADRFIEDTRKRWSLGHKSFRATGR